MHFMIRSPFFKFKINSTELVINYSLISITKQITDNFDASGSLRFWLESENKAGEQPVDDRFAVVVDTVAGMFGRSFADLFGC